MHKILTSIVLALLFVCPLAAEYPTHERGFRADAVYHLTELDTVNLFNGNLQLSIPIGQPYRVSESLSYQMTLRYAGNIWKYVEYCVGGIKTDGCRANTFAIQENGGMGWSLAFGELTYTAPSAEQTATGWMYTSPDGSEHSFYKILHDGDAEDAGDVDGTSVVYSRDGSYLRLTAFSSTVRILELPDGQKHRFEQNAADSKWYLTHIYNGFSSLDANSAPLTNYVAFDYPANATDATVKDTVIRDSTGRSHAIRFKSIASKARIASAELAKFRGGTPAVYTFEYQKDAYGSEAIVLPKPVSASGEGTATVALLSKVLLPNGESFSFSYFVPATADPKSGAMVQMVLPTLGKVEWDYSPFNFAADVPYTEAIGVSGRRLYDFVKTASPQHQLVQYTKYTGALGSNTVATTTGWTDDTGANAVVDSQTKYYFEAYSNQYVGLPINRSVTDSAGRYLSTETYDCDSAGFCMLDRKTFLKYEMDDVDVCAGSSCIHDRNRRVNSENTVYVTDNNRSATRDLSSFDGLGHYRTVSLNGTFVTGNTRTTTTQYNTNTRGGLSVGTYSVDASGNRLAGFTTLNASDPWVLGTYTSQSTSEAGVTAYTQACFDVARNFLLRSRVLKGSTAGLNDLLSVYTADADGNLVREEWFGGDTQTLSTSSLCSMALPAHTAASFRVDHTYQYGIRRTSQYKDTAGGTTGGLGYYTVDVDVDPSTGLITRSRDVAGMYTDYEYDSLGRLTWTKPQSGAWTQYDYRAAMNQTRGRSEVAVYQRPNGSTTAALARHSQEVDGLGRPYREAKLRADNWWSIIDTRYDHAGRKSKVSSSESYVSDSTPAANWTTTTYDPYGRPVTITTPDGSVTLYSYTGVRLVSKNVNVATSASGNTVSESYVGTNEEYDRQGRLWRVTEAAGTASATTTEYSYDVAGRLSKVCGGLVSGVCTQSRFFTYDKRGLLVSEQHPEKGAAGNGTVSYTYDARGHVLTKTEGPSTANFSLTYVYDRAERLTQVQETNRSNRLVKQFTFGTANALGVDSLTSYRKGRLLTATRYNYDRAGIGFDPVVTETYEYTGVGGRVSRRVTDVKNGTTVLASFDQRTTWNDLGAPLTTTYPDCIGGGCAAVDPARTVSNTYTNGFLTAVSGYANSISYHPNGMINTVAHANGLNTIQAVHANGMPRPDSYTVQDPSTGGVYWTTSSYAYDGAGNVKNMGWNYYVYDQFGRVVEGSADYVSPANGKVQRYTYDAFGNMLSMTTLVDGATTNTRTMGAVAATNRLCSGAMCSSGNLGLIDYDDGGNLKYVNGRTYTFDSFNMMATLSDGPTVNYVYTADDERVWAYTSSLTNSSRWYARGLDTSVLREYTTTGAAATQTWSFAKDYVYRDGSLLAAIASSGAVTHFHLDHLGSARLITDAGKGIVEKLEYFPFGEENVTPGGETKKFTGHERDFNTASGWNLDYMHARYYAGGLGRFLSTDPVYGNLSRPQSWNRYAYVLNNPVGYVDPDGRQALAYGETITVTAPDPWRQFWGDFFWFSSGVMNAFGSDVFWGAGRQHINNDAYQFGQLVGDGGAMVFGYIEINAGMGGELGGLAFDVTGVGLAVGVPVHVASGAVIVHGAGTTATAATHFMSGLKRTSGSGKQRATDIPSWAQGQQPKPGENGRAFAKRLMDERYGPGNYKTGPGSEFNKLQKYGDRAFKR